MIDLRKLKKGDKLIYANIKDDEEIVIYFLFLTEDYLKTDLNLSWAVFTTESNLINKYSNANEIIKKEDCWRINEIYLFLGKLDLQYVLKYNNNVFERIKLNKEYFSKYDIKIKSCISRESIYKKTIGYEYIYHPFYRKLITGCRFLRLRYEIFCIVTATKFVIEFLLAIIFFFSDNFKLAFDEYIKYRRCKDDLRRYDLKTRTGRMIYNLYKKDKYEQEVEKAKIELEEQKRRYIEMNKIVITIILAFLTIIISLVIK